MKHLVISFICDDKPGLVDALSRTISEHQGNWQTSSLHHLSGKFAGILEVSVDESQYAPMTTALEQLTDFNLQLVDAPNPTEKRGKSISLSLTANDRAGIVQDISSVIHQNHGNLIKLVSQQQSAPHSGQLMFTAKVIISVSENDVDSLIEALEAIENDLMVDINESYGI
ncbi:amino acid-binding protein [Thalassotalea sp. LPB0316]|uniref:glycine cleavage system protein R n=1 Tax=Thalassotalea sp. LPB0316 TaxID=2769490 RepID=UPI001867405E|nr:ACT domain-containing protein [Thalassotalea sp. LPB0316]QOL27017.1 amino acid-binding protein [Thalassotalea sp. LPB0316]